MKSAAGQVAILYLIVLVGFICDKVKLFTEATAKATINLLLYIITPCIIIDSFLKMEYSPARAKKFFLALGLMFLLHIVAIVLNLPFFRKKGGPYNPIYKYASIYGNVGFMALPLAKAVLGAKGVFYCSSGLIAFNIITFTHGVRVMAGSDYKFDWKKLIVNPGVLGVAIGLPLFLLDVQVPTVIAQPISLIAGLNTAVAMLIFGTYLANTDLKTMFLAKGIYLVALLKLIVLPVSCILLFKLMGIQGALLVACAISASVPSGNNTFMFSSKYGLDVGMASKTVALVSVLSIFTMPVIIAFAQSMA